MPANRHVIVVIRDTFSVHDKAIENELLSIPTAKSIASRLPALQCIVIEVSRGDEITYSHDAAQKKFVVAAYPERLLAMTASEHPAYAHIAQHWIADEYDLWTRNRASSWPPFGNAANRRIRIALLDSGISDHSALPALTFADLESSPRFWLIDRSALFGIHNLYGKISVVARFEHKNSNLWNRKCPLDPNGQPDLSHYHSYWSTVDRHVPPDHIAYVPIVHPRSFNFVDNTLNIYDSTGHGTSMAGLILGHQFGQSQSDDFIGLSIASQLLVFRVVDDSGVARESHVCAALMRAAELSADIALISVSCPADGQGAGAGANSPPITTTALKRACDHAQSAGVLIVAPTGNDAKEGLPAPCGYDSVMSVASITRDRIPSSFSNRAAAGEEIDVCSYGGEVPTGSQSTDWMRGNYILCPSLYNGYRGMYGTSVAAAIAAGCAAEWMSFVLQSGAQIGSPGLPLPSSSPRPWTPKQITLEMRLKADKRILKMNPPDPQMGSGLCTLP